MTFLVRNFRTRRNEIDIVCRDGGLFVFVEVKSRRRLMEYGRHPLLSGQKRRIASAAKSYLARIGIPQAPYRFDLVEVTFWPLLFPFLVIRRIRHYPAYWRGISLRR